MTALRILTILSLGIFLFACSSEEEKAVDRISIPVKLASVERKAIDQTIYGSGTLASKSEIVLSFKTGGIVRQFNVDEGHEVKNGQILARLDLSEIQSRYNQAKSALEKAQRDYARMNSLFQDSVVTLEQWQNSKTALDIARSNKKIAKFNLEHSLIKAPGRGRILKRFIEAEELVNPGTPVLMFGSSDDNWVIRIGVADYTVLDLTIGDSALVHFDAYPEKEFKASVAEIAAAADPRSGTYEVEVVLQQERHKLLSGFVGKVRIFPSARKVFDIIPVHAISEGNAGYGHVFVPNPDKDLAIKRSVKISGIMQEGILISGGLEGINQIIGDGAAYLSDSTKIRLIN